MGQSYKNHQQRSNAWVYGVFLPFVVNFVWAFWQVISLRTFASAVQFAMAIAFLILWWFVRRMALTVQDRVIRLEMRLRPARRAGLDARGLRGPPRRPARAV